MLLVTKAGCKVPAALLTQHLQKATKLLIWITLYHHHPSSNRQRVRTAIIACIVAGFCWCICTFLAAVIALAILHRDASLPTAPPLVRVHLVTLRQCWQTGCTNLSVGITAAVLSLAVLIYGSLHVKRMGQILARLSILQLVIVIAFTWSRPSSGPCLLHCVPAWQSRCCRCRSRG